MKKLLLTLFACGSALLMQAQSHVVLQTKSGNNTVTGISDFLGVEFLNESSVVKPTVQPTIRQYLESIKGENLFAADICSGDYRYFWPQQSQLSYTEDGSIAYADSVFYHLNYFSDGFVKDPATVTYTSDMPFGFQAALDDANAALAVIIPSNEAYMQAIERVKSHFVYSSIYACEETYLDGKYNRSDAWETAISTDSLCDMTARAWVMHNYVFPMAAQPNAAQGASRDALIDAFDAAKGQNTAWVTSRGDVLPCKPNFGTKAPVRRTNGLVYEVNTFDEALLAGIEKEYRVDCYYRDLFNIERTLANNGATAIDTIVSVGSPLLKDGHVLLVRPDLPSTKPSIQLRLPQLPSGKYDISLIRVPPHLVLYPIEAESDLALLNQNRFDVRLYYNTGQATGQPKSTTAITLKIADGQTNLDGKPYNMGEIEVIPIVRDYEIPYSYCNVPRSFPYIEIRSNASASDIKVKDGKAYTNTFCLGGILITAKTTE